MRVCVRGIHQADEHRRGKEAAIAAAKAAEAAAEERKRKQREVAVVQELRRYTHAASSCHHRGAGALCLISVQPVAVAAATRAMQFGIHQVTRSSS